MSQRQQMLDACANALLVIDDDVADLRPGLSDIQEDHGDLSRGQAPKVTFARNRETCWPLI
jgi:hypothetical protein